jgi:hypothetical protein
MTDVELTTPAGARKFLAQCKTSGERFDAKQRIKKVNKYNESAGTPGWVTAVLREA